MVDHANMVNPVTVTVTDMESGTRRSGDLRRFQNSTGRGITHFWASYRNNNNNNDNDNNNNVNHNYTFPVRRIGVYRDHCMITR